MKKLKKIFDQLNERNENYLSNNFAFEDECIEDSEEDDMSTQFLPIQKKSDHRFETASGKIWKLFT